jgi:arylsulfatase A-like enzyme
VAERRLDRRELLRTAGAAAAGTALLRAPRVRAAARPDGPNLLVVMIDSLRADHVGAYGLRPVHTPNLDALARESLRFTRGFPEAMPTVPARRSLLLGRRVYPWRGWRPVRDLPATPGWAGVGAHDTTWLSTLRAHGWWTGYVTDNPWVGFTGPFDGVRRSVDRFVPIPGRIGARKPASSVSERDVLHWLPERMRTRRYLTGLRQYLANTGAGRDERQSGAARVFTHAADVLREAGGKRPFALVVDCFDPHEPWDPPRKYLDLYGDPRYRGVEPGDVLYTHSSYLTAAERKRLPAVYAATVTMTDVWLGHFLDAFHASGRAQDTVLVLLSDHGILLGERGWTGKPALELHPELIQVPFLLRDPHGASAGGATPYFASPHDVGPTLLAMAGVPAPRAMNGSDLSPLLRGAQPRRARPFWYGGYANHFYVRTDDWAMIAGGNDRGRMLFDLHADPGERRDVAKQRFDVLDALYRAVLHDAGGTSLPYFP